MTELADRSLKTFLRKSTIAYANSATSEEEIDPGLYCGHFSYEDFDITDLYRVSPDSRTYIGVEEVAHGNVPVWRAAYTGSIMANVEPEIVDDILGFYKRALKKPAQELPIRGPRTISIGEYKYTLSSTRGPLKVARFAIAEEITHRGSRVYIGDVSGGRIDQ